MSELLVIKRSTLQAIADATKEARGLTDKLFPSNIPAHIKTLKSDITDSTVGVDPVVVAEAERVATAVLSKVSPNSITFIAMSDMHDIGDGENQYSYVVDRIRKGNLHAGQAAKIISDRVNPDFYACLGDYIYGSETTTTAQGLQCFMNSRKYIQDVIKDNESFLTVGNHDSMVYSKSVIGGDPLPYSVLSDIIGTYRYKDFESKKVRVICLNTADNSVNANQYQGLSGQQLKWFSDKLDLSDKSDSDDWGIIILSHHPLDWEQVNVAAECLACYLEGSTFSTTKDGVSISKDFNGKNKAKIIAQFHGHVHGFRVDDIHGLRNNPSGRVAQVKRVAIPNACFERNNEYGRNGHTDSNGIEFGEDITYNKIENDFSKDTSFCVVTIDLDNRVIRAYCYGMGIDREISYADVATHTITNNLTNAITSNNSSIVIDGATYSSSVVPEDGYVVDNIVVTMGGIDITESAVSGNNIIIKNITGDVVITVSTKVDDRLVSVINNITNATNSNTATSVFKGSTYSATIVPNTNYAVDTIKVTMGGTDVTNSVVSGNSITIDNVTGSIVITVTVYDNTPLLVSYDLVNVSSSNMDSQTLPNTGYTSTLTPNDGYSINTVKVYMGRVDITSQVYSNGTITISKVTDDIEIVAGSYINLVPTATTYYNSEDIYNNIGYKDNTYISDPGVYKDATGIVSTGYLRINQGDVIYIKGAELITNSYVRCYTQTLNGAPMYYLNSPNVNSGKWCTPTGIEIFSIEKLGGNYYKLSLSNNVQEGLYYRLSLSGTGERLVVTHNEQLHEGEIMPTYSVVNDLVNAYSSNPQNSVAHGSTYTATITVSSEYVLDDVIVMMGNVDITDSSYKDGTITIPYVDGNISITVVATPKSDTPPVKYTNLVPTSIDPSTGGVYNVTGSSAGYKNDVYGSGSGEGSSPDTSCVLTGLIAYGNKRVDPIYISGADITAASHCRILGFNSAMECYFQSAQGSSITTYFSVEKLGDKYYKVTPVSTSIGVTDYLRFSLIGDGENLIITINEPID